MGRYTWVIYKNGNTVYLCCIDTDTYYYYTAENTFRQANIDEVNSQTLIQTDKWESTSKEAQFQLDNFIQKARS